MLPGLARPQGQASETAGGSPNPPGTSAGFLTTLLNLASFKAAMQFNDISLFNECKEDRARLEMILQSLRKINSNRLTLQAGRVDF